MKVTLALILLCVIAFFLEDTWMIQNFALVSGTLLTQPWRAVTSMFLHADLMHLLLNMLVLFMFGAVLEQKVGSSWFLIIYLISGIMGSIGFEGYNFLTGQVGIGLGASGAIFGIFGALLVLKPKMVVYAYFVPMPLYIAVILYALLELVSLGAADQIAHSAHLLGLVGGFLMAKIYNRYGKPEGDVQWSS